MSDTDDTDVLLLIPPNFFLVQSSGSEDSLQESSRTVVHKPLSCTAQVLDKLVNQVQTLESRLDSLEITSDTSSLGTIPKPNKTWNSTDSFNSCSLDRKSFTFPRRRRRKIGRRQQPRESVLTSLESLSTRDKDIPRLKLQEDYIPDAKYCGSLDIQSMDGDISSIVSTPSKKNDKLLLHEIDEFLTKVENYESPDSKFKDQESTLSSEDVIKAAGDYISQRFESKNEDIRLPSGRVVSSKVLDKYIYLVKSNAGSSVDETPKQSNFADKLVTDAGKSTSEISKHQDTRSPSIRRLNFEKDVQPTSTPKKPQTTKNPFQPSSNKIYERASKVLEQYKSNYSTNSHTSDYYMSPKKNFKMPEIRPFMENKDKLLQNKLLDTIDTDLLSLSELWGEKADHGERVDSGKLEEERLKREHCEAMIQQLQKKILDQQEKLAVAVRVDRAKDAAISKLRESWLKLTGSLDKAEERHRSALEKMMREVDNFRFVADEAQKKTSHFESELYKALDLAHDYQEKCKQLQSEKKELQEGLDKTVSNANELVAAKDKEIEILKENYNTVMSLNKQSTDCVKNLEETLEKEKAAHEATKTKITELSRRVQSVNDETILVTQERDILKDKVNEERSRCSLVERQLCEKQNQCSDLLKKCDFLDNEVKTLRKHLELQKNELKCHYQKQLEDAVLAKLQEFQLQLDQAEREMENDIRGKENAIVDSFNKQIIRIEEQHKLEVNVLEEKQKEEIKLYRLQLAQASEKISLLENKLESYRRRRGAIASQLHGVMQAQWRQALCILTGNTASQDSSTLGSAIGQDSSPPVPPLTMPLAGRGLVRSEPREERDERRPSTDLFNFEGLSDNELQQYVKMLLTKPANFEDNQNLPQPDHHHEEEEPTSDKLDASLRLQRRSRAKDNKPPWKA